MARFEEQHNEDNDRTQDIENRKHNYTKDQAHEDSEKTKRIEELKRKQDRPKKG